MDSGPAQQPFRRPRLVRDGVRVGAAAVGTHGNVLSVLLALRGMLCWPWVTLRAVCTAVAWVRLGAAVPAPRLSWGHPSHGGARTQTLLGPSGDSTEVVSDADDVGVLGAGRGGGRGTVCVVQEDEARVRQVVPDMTAWLPDGGEEYSPHVWGAKVPIDMLPPSLSRSCVVPMGRQGGHG